MTNAYDKNLIAIAKKIAEKQNLDIKEGVYMYFAGPNFETPAEIRAARILGADAAGMSTVPEVIVARHCGLKVMGVSIITDEANDNRDEDVVIDGAEIVMIADQAADRMNALFTRVIEEL